MKYILKSIVTFLMRIILKKKNIIIEKNVSINKTSFSKFNKVSKNTVISNSTMGDYSYVGWNCNLNNVEIGAYSSIGPFTEVIYGTHPVNLVSTHPAFYSTRKQCGFTFVDETKFDEFNFVSGTNRSAIIGNDVWIGYGVKIIEGVRIGDGAVVLAGAIVTKDIEPYSIVGGVPAKHIKYRFDEETCQELLDSQWWAKDMTWIKNNMSNFLDITNFKEAIKVETIC